MPEIRDKYIYSMSKSNKPIETVKSGDEIIFHTIDCFGGQLDSSDAVIGELDWDHINPSTGPVYIEGALPGDCLKIEILDITTNDTGIMCAIPENGVFASLVTEESIKRIPVENGELIFSDSIRLPLRPMIGVIGVAPPDDAISCGIPGVHGGNMDNKRICKGTCLYLPVFHEGALLSMGDLHAAMGDGEIMVTGVEIGGTVTVRVSVIKESISTPLLEDDEFCYVIYSHRDIEKAIFEATRMMGGFLEKALKLSFNESGMLISAAADVKICQVVDPERTITVAVPRSILPGFRL